MEILAQASLAFLAGLASFVSPCVLPIVPSYLSFVAGSRPVPGNVGGGKQPNLPHSGPSLGISLRPVSFEQAPKASLSKTLGFVLGFILVFALLGLVFAGGGMVFGQLDQVLRVIGGSIILVFAANMLWNFIPFLNADTRLKPGKRPQTWIEALLVGMAFGAGWTPCIGPFLSAVLFSAAAGQSLGLGLLYLTLYGIGLGLPFVALSLWLERWKPFFQVLKTHNKTIKLASAIIMAVFAILMITGRSTLLNASLPALGSILQTWSAGAGLWPDILAYSLLAVIALLGGLRMHRYLVGTKEGGRRLSKLGTSLSGLALGLGIAQALGAIHLWQVLASWLQYQGI